MKPIETVKIYLTKEETEWSRNFLNLTEADPNYGRDEVPLIKTAKFTSIKGLEADIKCCNGDSPYVDPVAFIDGHQVCVLEVDDTLEGEYWFNLGKGEYYVVEVIPFSS